MSSDRDQRDPRLPWTLLRALEFDLGGRQQATLLTAGWLRPIWPASTKTSSSFTDP